MFKKFLLTLTLLTFLFTTQVFASEIGYELSDGSTDVWEDATLIPIDSNYALVAFDFETLKEDRASAYSVIGIDLSDFGISNLYIDGGTLIDISVDGLYLVATNEENSSYYTMTVADFNEGDTVYFYNGEYSVSSYLDGYITFDAVEADIPLFDESGNLIAVTISDTTAVSTSLFYDIVADYIGSEPETIPETEEETTTSSTSETVAETESDALDFSELEALISEATEYDSEDITNALLTARSTYLNATTQEEIDAAADELEAAIQNYLSGEETESAAEQYKSLAVVIIAILFAVVLLVIIKKRGKSKSNSSQKPSKTQNFTDSQMNDSDFQTLNMGTSQLPGNTVQQYTSNTQNTRDTTSPVQNSEIDAASDIDDEPGTTILTSDVDDEPDTTFLVSAKLIEQKTGREISIMKFPFTIGRGKCDYHISNESLSRPHCKITYENNKYYLYDLSQNGTFTQNGRIGNGNKAVLKNNDTIRLSFGSHAEEFTFCCGGD